MLLRGSRVCRVRCLRKNDPHRPLAGPGEALSANATALGTPPSQLSWNRASFSRLPCGTGRLRHGRMDRNDHGTSRPQPGTQSSQAPRGGGHRIRGTGRGFLQRHRRRAGRRRSRPSAGSGGDADGGRAASAVRRGCIVRGHRVLAHAATRAQSAGRARPSRWQVRANGGRQTHQLYRRKVEAGGLRLPCEDRPASGRLGLHVWRHARRRGAGVRHVPHLAAWPRGVHLHQLRRSGHADHRQEVRPAGRGHAAGAGVRQ